MSSVEDRQNSPTTGQIPMIGSLQIPEPVSKHAQVEQLDFPQSRTQPLGSSQVSASLSAPNVTHPLFDPIPVVGVTRKLPEVQTGALLPLKNTTTALRQPIVIRSTGKKSSGTMRPPNGRRWVIHVAVTALLVLVGCAALMLVLPAGTNAESGYNPFRPIMNWNWVRSNNNNSNYSLMAQQAATVTAVTQDGYESGNRGQTYAGLPTPPPSSGSAGYDGFTYGQCTFWADLRYHQMTGQWVPWGGDAWSWVNGARAYGWNVSSSPHFPSIIVLQPGVEGAGGFGHVAVVERINTDGSVYTSNWNWYANGGGWARLSYWTFYPGPGVSFIWA